MKIAYNGNERRRSQRAPYPVEIWYRDSNKKNQGFKHAYGKNISQHGLLFETYESFPACTILELKLILPALPGFSPLHTESFLVLGEVVRAEEVKKPWLYCIAVSFCKIEAEVCNFLGKYITKLLELPAQSESIAPAQ